MALSTLIHRGAVVDPFNSLPRDFDTVLNRLFSGNVAGDSIQRLAPYAVDVREDAEHIYVDAELPGFKKEQIDITLENQTLTISAQRGEETEAPAPGEYLLNERRFARFLRAFKLPPTVDERQVDAKLSDGVLHVVLNKREESKPRKITVA